MMLQNSKIYSGETTSFKLKIQFFFNKTCQLSLNSVFYNCCHEVILLLKKIIVNVVLKKYFFKIFNILNIK